MQHSAGSWPDFSAGNVNSPNQGRGLSLAGELSNMLTIKLSALDYWMESWSNCPWSATVGSIAPGYRPTIRQAAPRRPLYSAEERRRRDSTKWTLVQGVLAPIQFAVFLVSLGLVLNYLLSGSGYAVATASVVVKTGILYTIMITGSIWEKRVFGRYLFAASFYWEDMVSMLVLALHSLYLAALIGAWGTPEQRMLLALAAYLTYAVNASQFLLKLRAARREATPEFNVREY